jgi:hypothetical protein
LYNISTFKQKIKKSSTDNYKIVGYRTFDKGKEIFFYNNKGELKKYTHNPESKFRKFIEIIQDSKYSESNVNGYIDSSNDRDRCNFKLVDKNTTRKSTGAICEQINSKESIGKLINNVSEKIKYEKKNFKNNGKKQSKTKDQMCAYLEYLLRYRENKKYKNLKWFYRTNEK